MLVLPDCWKSCIKTDLTDLLLSSRVSVPTSRRPMLWSGILYFSSREVTTSLCEQRCDDWSHAGAPVMQMELMSSRSVVKAIFCWPRPVVYLPAPALSNFSVGIIRFRCRALRGGAHRARSGRRMSGGNRRQWRLCRHSEESAPCRGRLGSNTRAERFGLRVVLHR